MHLYFAESRQTAQLSGTLTKMRMPRILKKRYYYDFDAMFLSVWALATTRLGTVEKYDLTLLSLFYIQTASKVLSGHEAKTRVQADLETLRFEIWKLKIGAEKSFSQPCSSGLFRLQFHLLDHSVDDLRRFGSLAFTNVGPFGHFTVHTNNSYRMTFQGFPTRLHEILESMSSALNSVQRPGCKAHGVPLMHLYSEKMSVKRGGEYLVRDRVCLSLPQVSERAERAVSAVLLKRLHASVVDERFRDKWVALFVTCLNS